MKNVTDKSIAEAVKIAQLNAKASIEKLGMLSLLEKNKIFACPEVSYLLEDCVDDEEEEDEKEPASERETDAIAQSQIQEICTDDPSEVEGDIKLHSDNGFIDDSVQEKLNTHSRLLLLKHIVM